MPTTSDMPGSTPPGDSAEDPGARPDYDDGASLRKFLEREGLAMSKRFGQNFLVERRARERLLASLEAPPGALVWEIGPGIGAMTGMLLDSGHRLTAFEIDHGFARVLGRIYGSSPSFSLVEGDFIKTWKARLSVERPDAVFGNLPYSAAGAIIGAMVEGGLLPGRMVFTVQKEAAQRMAAGPGTKEYSAFSVLCTSSCRVKLLYDFGAASFWPRPRVTSTVVLMTPRQDPVCGEDRAGFARFVRTVFSSRRKTLKNNLAKWKPPRSAALPPGAVDVALAAIKAPPDVRAEALDPSRLGALYRMLGADPTEEKS